ncbi:hypothetical protein HIM_01512 [Hirsutella minnesotensis 3608]|nr:hypothetical protein HIM_01512 [Hirsutella minnesotensis 3608]
MSTTPPRISILYALLLSLLCILPAIWAADKVYIDGNGIDGVSRKLDVSRYPALYTGDFDDCLGGESLFNVTKFDAAYYADNLTVLFHLDGTTNVARENLILHISVEAYGENRFNMTYDPCKANIASMCPLNASVPVTAFAIIPISPTDVAGIPSIALGIPDLEGFARLQIFANSTKTEIGCFQAVMTNGNSFSQPKSVGTIMGIFTAAAALASFATAIYGLSIPHMRMHYAHSFSVLVVFETFQSIFFSGALSVTWPSVLPAWWSNFAWSAGMFANDQIVQSLSSFTGTSANSSQVGGAGSYQINNNGGLAQQIYGRSLASTTALGDPIHTLARRAAYNASNPYDYTWNGNPRTPGLPMPGTWLGFGGTLSVLDIPEAAAFLLGLIWLLVIIAGIALFVVVAKTTLDLLVRTKVIKTDGFDFFRAHMSGYVVSALLRTLFIAFFTMMTLSLFQFSMHGPAGPVAIAAIVFILFLAGVGGITAYACFSRLRQGKYEVERDTIQFEKGTLFRKIPFVATTRASQNAEQESAARPRIFGKVPFARVKYTDQDANRTTVHRDEGFIKRFGWLTARYRRTRWWFPSIYLAYLFIRACFIGGGSHTPLAQVFGLFIFDILALPIIIKLSPFEGNRNTAVAIWMLSISKVVTTGLSIAFLPAFALSRIVATVLGIIIIVVQGFVAIAVVVLIALGLISSWMSMSRNGETFPEPLDQPRIQYFEHVQTAADDLPPKPKGEMIPETKIEPYFDVKDVRRAPKIGDNGEILPEHESNGQLGAPSAAASVRRSRANSASSRCSVGSLPRTGRTHRASWSSKDVAQWDAEMNRGDVQRTTPSRSGSLRMPGLDTQIPASASRRPPPMTPMRESFEGPMWGVPVDNRTQPAAHGRLNSSDLEKNGPLTEEAPRETPEAMPRETPFETPKEYPTSSSPPVLGKESRAVASDGDQSHVETQGGGSSTPFETPAEVIETKA